jgi:acyl-CoA synthetase (AMP-forming)/AMP-acid ligase II
MIKKRLILLPVIWLKTVIFYEIIVNGGLLVNNNELLNAWKSWKGSVNCTYTKKLWGAKEIYETSNYLASKLSQTGFKEGDIVALILSNTAAFPISLYALLQLGCNPLLLHASTTYNELTKLLNSLPIKYFIHDFVKDTSTIDNNSINIVFENQLENINLTVGILDILPSALYKSLNGTILHLTSGTYGKPLICIRNQYCAVAEAINYVNSIPVYNNINIAVTTPLSHAFAYGFGLISTLITDSTIIIDNVFNPKRLLRTINEHHCDILTIVPPMAKTFIELNRINPFGSFPSIVFYAGTSCNEVIEKTFEEELNTKLYSIYGSTETGAISSNFSLFDKLPGLGNPLENVQINIANISRYGDLGENIGEVNVKSTSMMQGYYDNYNANDKIDFFFTGDIGSLNESIVNLSGRVRAIINKGGFKIDPKEIEDQLLTHPDIIDAAVYPGKSESGDEIILAALVAKNKIDITQLRTFCLDNLTSFKIPSKFYILDELPKTASGKYLKVKLPCFNSSAI